VISSINNQPGEAADVMVVAVSLIGWRHCLQSLTSKPRRFFRATLHGIWNQCVPKGALIGKYIAVF